MVLVTLFACSSPGAKVPTVPFQPPPIAKSSGFAPPELSVTGAAPDRVVLISVAGLTPDRYLGRPGEAPLMATLANLAAAGVAVEAIKPVAPPSRYPAHATLVSGRRPANHGVPANVRLGDRGVRDAAYVHASFLRGPTLWSVAKEANRRVAALGWPTTIGASVDYLLPEIPGRVRGSSWMDSLNDTTTPWLFELARQYGGDDPGTLSPGPARDATLGKIACAVSTSTAPPDLMLLNFSQTLLPLRRSGPDAEATRAAFVATDAEIARLLECLQKAGKLESTAILVVGDHGTVPIHTVVNANSALVGANLISVEQGSTRHLTWRAIARSNGGSAFVYARSDMDAVRARRALESASTESGVFDVVSAEEMLESGADPEAWFGLEARPGYAFGDTVASPLLQPAAERGAGGYLSNPEHMGPGLVGWGRGLRHGVIVPWMQQIDVAPTVARLLDIRMVEVEGQPLVGVLELSPKPRGAAAIAR